MASTGKEGTPLNVVAGAVTGIVGNPEGESAGDDAGEYPRYSVPVGYPRAGCGDTVGLDIVPPSRSSTPFICRFSFIRLF